MAGGVDRSGQSVGIIFEKGNYLELSYGLIDPEVSGKDLIGGAETGSVAGNHTLPGLALKYGLGPKLSITLIYGHDYGSDIRYPAGKSQMLGGTLAKLNSEVVSAILRYRFDDSFSVHGGLRGSKAGGRVALDGLAYGGAPPAGVSGYDVSFNDAWGMGYLIGAAYERPDIALRVALTYFSEVTHNLDTTEDFGAGPLPASTTSVDTPQAWNLDVQSGVAPNTLVFGSVRWVDWSDFRIDPLYFTPIAGGLVSLEDTITYTLGVGYRFSDAWSGSVLASYEPANDRDVSPLAPTAGYRSIGAAAVYTRDNMKVTLGARYVRVGDANAAPGGRPAAEMQDNHALALGVKVGWSF